MNRIHKSIADLTATSLTIQVLHPPGFWTSNGIYFGESPISLISADEIGGPEVSSGTDLMMSLIARTNSPASRGTNENQDEGTK